MPQLPQLHLYSSQASRRTPPALCCLETSEGLAWDSKASALSWMPASLPWALSQASLEHPVHFFLRQSPFSFDVPSPRLDWGPNPNDFSEISRVKVVLPLVNPSE